jgi:hypothetical protein
MKKELRSQARKITIAKETLRRMAEGQLREIAGGIFTAGGTSCGPNNPCYVD